MKQLNALMFMSLASSNLLQKSVISGLVGLLVFPFFAEIDEHLEIAGSIPSPL